MNQPPAPPTRVLLLVTIDAIGVTRIPHLLATAGCHVSLFAPRRLAVHRSRYVAQPFAAASNLPEYTEQLRQHLQVNHYDWIIVGDEVLLWHLIEQRQKHANERWIDQCLPVSVTRMQLLDSKHRYLLAAQALGLPVPTLLVCETLAAAKSAAQAFHYPVILRAAQSLSGSGVQLVHAPDELREAYAKFARLGLVAVQRYIPAARSAMTEILYDHGRLVAWHSSLQVAGWPHAQAASCARAPFDHPHLKDHLERLGQLTGFHGLAGVDWLFNESSGQLHMVEFNSRPTPGYHLSHVASVDFARALRGMLNGLVEQHAPQLKPGPHADQLMFPQYLYRATDDRAFHALWRCWRDVPWHDPLLVTAHLRRWLCHYAPSHWRATLRQWRQGTAISPITPVQLQAEAD